MTSNNPTPSPLDTYKQATAGSISGFNTVDIVSDPTLGESDSSAAAITQQIANLVAQGIPSHIKQCIQLIQSHETNYNNPHKDTFSSISLESSSVGNVATIFNRIINGTVPTAPPVCSFTAELDVGAPFIGLQCSRDSQVNIINAQGMLETLDENVIRADYSFGSPTYPCWPSVTQLLSPPNPSTNSNFSPTGATLTTPAATLLPQLDPSAQYVLVDNGTASAKQLSYTNPSSIGLTTNQDYTFSIFIYPLKPSGSLYMTLNEWSWYIDLVNPLTQFVFSQTDSTLPTPLNSLAILPNGWWRIGLTFTLSSPSLEVSVGYNPNRYSSLSNWQSSLQNNSQVYQGVSGQNIFGVCYPQLVNIGGLTPVITSASTLAPTSLTYPGSPTAIPLTNFIGKIKFLPFGGLSSNVIYNVCNLDNAFQLTQNKDTTTYTLQGHEVPNIFKEPLVNGSMCIGCASYSSNQVSFITSNMENQTVITDFVGNEASPLPTINTITMGPFPGYISECTHYSISDNCNVLSLLAQI